MDQDTKSVLKSPTKVKLDIAGRQVDIKEIEIESSSGDIFKAWIGRDAQNNWDIITAANPNDIWFHLEDHPSPHIILRINNNGDGVDNDKKYDKRTINRCAYLCKAGSKLKDTKNVYVIYTEVKNVTKADKPGAVTTTKTKRIKI